MADMTLPANGRHGAEVRLKAGYRFLKLTEAEKALLQAQASLLSDEQAAFLYRMRMDYNRLSPKDGLVPFSLESVWQRWKLLAPFADDAAAVWLTAAVMLPGLRGHFECCRLSLPAYKQLCGEAADRLREMLPLSGAQPADRKIGEALQYLDGLLSMRGLPAELRAELRNEEKGQNRILSRQPDLREHLAAARRGNEASAGSDALTFLHFSDIHGAERNLEDILELADAFRGETADILFTGDMTRTSHENGSEWFFRTPGTEKILAVIGNHDVVDNPWYDWEDLLTMQEAAEEFIEPGLKNASGVRHEAGTTFYSRTYEESGVLLLALDVMLLQQDDLDRQYAFVCGELKRALAEHLTVIAMLHDFPAGYEPISYPQDWKTEPCGRGLDRRIPAAIDRFMREGGAFTLYLAGHEHLPGFMRDREYPRQLYSIAGGAGTYTASKKQIRLPGTLQENMAQFVTLQPAAGTVSFTRIGFWSDIPSCARLVYDCRTGELREG